jgi:hypothetical protein
MISVFTMLALVAPMPSVPPTVPPTVPASNGDMLTALYVLVGSIVVKELVTAIVGLVKWLAGRTVAREDKDRADLQEKLQKMDGRFEELGRAVDSRSDKQKEFYLGELQKHTDALNQRMKEFEFQLRQDASRAAHDAVTAATQKRR